MQTDKYFNHRFGHLAVHCEIFTAPINRGAETTNLVGNRVAGSFLPFPYFF